uniref:Fibronectin type-III domain-containing protein n=1 Tax=Astyanax mexicanus TaxID=7994 RepID=A0A8B9KL44_ASTMX
MLDRTRVGVLMFLCAGLSRVSALGFHLSDVSVMCHNFENVVSWNNPNPQLQPEYIVTLRGYSRETESIALKTTSNFMDISEYTQNIEEIYFVSVKTASADESFEVNFTYKQDFPDLVKKCTVDFPSMNTSALRHTIEISFDHPLDVYYIKVNSDDDVFKYTVRCNETACGEYECTDLCTAEIPVPESLYGQCFSLHFTGELSSTRFEGSKDVCVPVEPEKKTDVHLITGLVCGTVVLLMLVIVAGIEIYKRMNGSDSQRAISKFLQSLGVASSETPVIEPERPHMSEINSISDAPLLVTPDDDVSTPITLSPEEVTHMPITLISEMEEQRASEEEEAFDNGGYDRQKFPLEMSPGDIVDAYHHGKN